MNRNQLPTYLLIGAVGLGVALATGINPGFLLILLVCPLMMVLMMRGMMSGQEHEDHTGHGCEHDPTRAGFHTDR